MKNGRKNSAYIKRVALCGVFAAFAIVLGYIEYLVPIPIGIYGVKLGLANLAVVSMLFLTDAKTAFTVNAVRIILCGLLFGSPVSFAYSAAGGVFSGLLMWCLKKSLKLSPIGVGVTGGMAHNVAQLSVAAFLMDSLKIALYLPVLLLAGVITGLVIGTVSLIIVNNKALRRTLSAYEDK